MTVRNFAGIGMVTVIVLLVTVGANPQKQNSTRQGKSQLACEKDYYGRIYPLLERTHWDLGALEKAGRATSFHVEEVHLELLFASLRLGKITKKEFDAKFKP